MGTDGPDGNAIRASLHDINHKLDHALNETASLRRDIVKYDPEDDLMLWTLDCAYQTTQAARTVIYSLLSRFP